MIWSKKPSHATVPLNFFVESASKTLKNLVVGRGDLLVFKPRSTSRDLVARRRQENGFPGRHVGPRRTIPASWFNSPARTVNQ
jgi:hypothetical protein